MRFRLSPTPLLRLRPILAPLAILLVAPALFYGLPSLGAAHDSPGMRRDFARGVDLAVARYGLDIGAWIYLEGKGVIYEREAGSYKPAASAIKSFIALDFLMQRQTVLETAFPEPAVIWTHPAFRGFTKEGLSSARRELEGKTYWELGEIMMGRGGYSVEVYNAACNLLLIDLGGPEAVGSRIRGLSSEFSGLDLDRYMEQWHGNGDNRATPRALAELYLMLSRNTIPTVSPKIHRQLREFLFTGSKAGSKIYEKSGTLYPLPMARIRAGYMEREGANLVYALMGNLRDPKSLELPDAFVLLLASMDTLTTIIQEVF